ncbi:hypothetical protein KKI23_00570 [Patescibacteria group bacterium]|nr:hypothetical protein [Patescibacteria group bacterium]
MKKSLLATLRYPTAYLLIAVNLIPIIGVIFWDWDSHNIITLYVLETIMIGALAYIKLVILSPGNRTKYFLFFFTHFFIFGGAALSVLLSFLDPKNSGLNWSLLIDIFPTISWALLALVANHLISTIWEIVSQKKSKIQLAGNQLGIAYLRMMFIIVLSLPLVLFSYSGGAIFGVVALVLIKILVELFLYSAELHGDLKYFSPETNGSTRKYL